MAASKSCCKNKSVAILKPLRVLENPRTHKNLRGFTDLTIPNYNSFYLIEWLC